MDSDDPSSAHTADIYDSGELEVASSVHIVHNKSSLGGLGQKQVIHFKIQLIWWSDRESDA